MLSSSTILSTATIIPFHTAQRHPFASYYLPQPHVHEVTEVREPKGKYQSTPTAQHLVNMATELSDQMNRLHALNRFFYVLIEGLVKDVELLNDDVLYGLWLNMRWLSEQSASVHATVNDLRHCIQQLQATEDKANTKG